MAGSALFGLGCRFYHHSSVCDPLLCVHFRGRSADPCEFLLRTDERKSQGTGTFPVALLFKYRDLSGAGLPSCDDPHKPERQPDQFYCAALYSAHVDELPAAHPCVADTIGKKRCDQQHPFFPASAGAEYHQHTGGHCPWHGIQLPAVHGAASLQHPAED